jgi:hypothetical protein
MKKSHTIQQMLNYFDSNDTRVRENSTTIDAQLLNVAAEQLDDLEQRTTREIQARSIHSVPACIDNRGVYQAVRLPSGYVLPPEGTDPTIEGLRGGVWTTINPYDDRLPVPVRVEMDPNREPFLLSNPVIMDVTGSGDDDAQIWDLKSATPGVLTLGNRLTFFFEGLSPVASLLDILIEGERYPRPAWVGERVQSHEILTTGVDGILESQFAWAVVNKITVRNMPSGARCRCWILPVTVPQFPEITRNFTHFAYRNRLFPRYWVIDNINRVLLEQYHSNNFIGLEYVQSYSLPEAFAGLAIEPNTWGMYTVSAGKLYYSDRREPWPDDLSVTGITREPLYGIDVVYDQTQPGVTRYAELRPVSYAGAGRCNEFRYLVEDPAGTLSILLPDGSLAVYSGSTGWRRGQPRSVSLPLLQIGTYVFSIECMDQNGQSTVDYAPYANLAFTPLVTLDLSLVTSTAKGIAFDHLQRLWLWTGDYAVPLRVSYDAYVLDRDSSTVFLTDLYEQVRFS